MISPLISVIIPAFNAGRFLSELLETLVKQTYSNLEILIMNDGSTDNTQTIIETYIKQDSRIKSFIQENQGQSAARNNALGYASGEYVAFLDADDLILEDYFQKLYDATEGWKDLALCSYRKFNSDTGETLLERETEDWNIPFTSGYSHVFQYSPCARLCRMDFIKKYNFLFGVGEQLEDGPYCMAQGILANAVGIVNETLYYYRVYKASTMGSVRAGKQKPKVPYRSMETAIQQVLQNTNDPIKLQILEYCSIKILAGWLTNMYKNCDLTVHREICTYCYSVMDKYFPDINNNPLIDRKTGKGKLPLPHREAVVLFMKAWRSRTLLLYSSLSVLALRLTGMD